MNRREFSGALALGSLAAFAPRAYAMPVEDEDAPFTADTVRILAERLASQAYEAPQPVPEWARELTYDQYRDIRYRSDAALWLGEGRGFTLELLHTGFVYEHAVDTYVVEAGKVAPFGYSPELFTFGPLVETIPTGERNLCSGIKIRSQLNSGEVWDEVAAFQGASYFRAVSESLVYGLSARGLAVNTAEPAGEEFPAFRTFWIERPTENAKTLTVHALLDSPSVTGAYQFKITPGHTTRMEVDATLFGRETVTALGLAPLTSMFLFDGTDPGRFVDFRPAVHDSDGLVIRRGNREWIWRPLANPGTLQLSAFVDENPSLFGLAQRARRLEDYRDLEARYDLRPSATVEPKGGWGEGRIVLVEIPTERESNDNIVAFWRPEEPLAQGESLSFGYWLNWGPPVVERRLACVRATRCGLSADAQRRLFVLDFEAPTLPGGAFHDDVDLRVSASQGSVHNAVLRANPDDRGYRASFELAPDNAELSELRFVLERGSQPVSETWLYRWTR